MSGDTTKNKAAEAILRLERFIDLATSSTKVPAQNNRTATKSMAELQRSDQSHPTIQSRRPPHSKAPEDNPTGARGDGPPRAGTRCNARNTAQKRGPAKLQHEPNNNHEEEDIHPVAPKPPDRTKPNAKMENVGAGNTHQGGTNTPKDGTKGPRKWRQTNLNPSMTKTPQTAWPDYNKNEKGKPAPTAPTAVRISTC